MVFKNLFHSVKKYIPLCCDLWAMEKKVFFVLRGEPTDASRVVYNFAFVQVTFELVMA